MHQYISQYKKSLLQDVIPFWERYSPDIENGGYFTCLDRFGKCYDTDKFIWLQARQVWTFSTMYQQVEQKALWLEMARHGINFLDKFAFDSFGDCYFSLNKEGKPLVEPYNIFSDCFVALAYGAFFKASENEEYAVKALGQFDRIIERSTNPKGKYNKQVYHTRPLKNFALPMILCNLSLELEEVLPKKQLEQTINHCLDEILNDFLYKEKNLLLENVFSDGSFSDSFEGRLVNPGHGIEACWFLLDIAERKQDQALINKLTDLLISQLEFGWDKEYEGIYYFMDILGLPPQQLEWDQKLWWVHLEALVALTKAYRMTGDERCFNWFKKVHQYTWEHFPDKKSGLEWYGYLNRRGEKLLQLKGGKWKGCFHVPRALLLCYKEMEKMLVLTQNF